MIRKLFKSLVEKELIYEDYIAPSPRVTGWFLTNKGKAVISNTY